MLSQIGGVAYYLLAELPSQHMADFKCAIIESRFAEGCASPMDPYKRLPELKPSSVNLFEPLLSGWKHGPGVALVGHYEILSMEHLLALPKFQWNQVYHTPEVLEHGVQGAVERSIAEGGELQAVTPTYVPHVANTVTLRTIAGNQWT